MRCRCSASQESLETISSRALRRSAGGTLSSRSRMSASAFAFAAFSIIEGLLPGTNIIDLMGFIWNSVTRARRQQCHRKLEHACSFRLELSGTVSPKRLNCEWLKRHRDGAGQTDAFD